MNSIPLEGRGTGCYGFDSGLWWTPAGTRRRVRRPAKSERNARPTWDWNGFAHSLPVRNEDAVLPAMDRHIKEACLIGPDWLKEFVSAREDEVAMIRELIKKGESRFVVLEIGSECKSVLKATISVRFEPYLVALLREQRQR